ncbi:MAG: hypothetical protein ACSHX6_02765 [Akkermansiaceae bacterium]
MKKTLLKIAIASLCLALPMTISSCDGSDNSTNIVNNGGAGGSGGDDDEDDNDSNADCFEGKSYRFIGTQTTTTETTIPVSSRTVSDINYDLTVEYLDNGTTHITGVTDITKISTTVAGFTTNVTAGLGPVDVDQFGTYTCSTDTTDNTNREVTVIEDGITTVYTLTFTSSSSGTFVTSVSGTKDGATIESSSSGTFTEV